MTIIYLIKSFKFFKQLVDGLNSEFFTCLLLEMLLQLGNIPMRVVLDLLLQLDICIQLISIMMVSKNGRRGKTKQQKNKSQIDIRI